MLHNLKLGYGDTKTEMERLFADAQAISGIEYNIDSYADVVSAIYYLKLYQIEKFAYTAAPATALKGKNNSH